MTFGVKRYSRLLLHTSECQLLVDSSEFCFQSPNFIILTGNHRSIL